MKKNSTSALAKVIGVSTKELFLYFQEKSFINRDGDDWVLTTEGKTVGGEYQESSKFGKYIVWPENIDINDFKVSNTKNNPNTYMTAKALASYFDVSAKKINFILSELGWLKKGIKGWLATEQGVKLGAIQAEDKSSGIPFVRWPDNIKETKSLIESIDQVKGKSSNSEPEEPDQQVNKEKFTDTGFREKFEAKHRSADGHFVRSKAEMLIDNWLYMAEIVHAYERKLPIEEDVYCDFYIPTGKVYIEYWGYENEAKYLARKQQKLEIYQKYGFNLIELNDVDVQNLDDILPRMLLKYGVQSY